MGGGAREFGGGSPDARGSTRTRPLKPTNALPSPFPSQPWRLRHRRGLHPRRAARLRAPPDCVSVVRCVVCGWGCPNVFCSNSRPPLPTQHVRLRPLPRRHQHPGGCRRLWPRLCVPRQSGRPPGGRFRLCLLPRCPRRRGPRARRRPRACGLDRGPPVRRRLLLPWAAFSYQTTADCDRTGGRRHAHSTVRPRRRRPAVRRPRSRPAARDRHRLSGGRGGRGCGEEGAYARALAALADANARHAVAVAEGRATPPPEPAVAAGSVWLPPVPASMAVGVERAVKGR